MFSIDTDKVKAQASDLNEYSDELYKISKSIEDIGNSVKMDYKYYTSISNVKNSISSISKSVGNRAKNIDALGNGLNTSVGEYIKAENDIVQGRVNAPQAGGGSGGGGGSAWGGNSGDAGNGSGGGGGSSFGDSTGSSGRGNSSGGGRHDNGWKVSEETGFHAGFGDDKNIVDEERKNNPDNDIARHRSVDGEKVDEDEYDKVKGAEKKGTIAEVNVGVEYDKSAASAGALAGNKEDGGPYAGIEANLGRAKADASFKAGIYQYDKDGNKIIAPAVNAKCGASYSLINVEAEAGAGDDNLGIVGKGEVNVGKVSAEAEANVDFISEDGKLDPQVNVSASAEAIAAEAEGEIDVKILGTESKLKAGVNVGVGVHADVGIEDGKIKCDFGASLGVGFNVGFELDVGGAVEKVGGAIGKGVNAVKSGAKSAWKKFKSWF